MAVLKNLEGLFVFLGKEKGLFGNYAVLLLVV